MYSFKACRILRDTVRNELVVAPHCFALQRSQATFVLIQTNTQIMWPCEMEFTDERLQRFFSILEGSKQLVTAVAERRH